MSKGKKNKWKRLPGEFRTCITAMAVLLVTGIGLFLYGQVWCRVSDKDIRSTQGEVISVEKVRRNLKPEEIEDLREEGYDEDYIKNEFAVKYRYAVNGEEYQLEKRMLLDEEGIPEVGDKEKFSYIIRNGKVVVDPDTDFTYTFVGVILIILGAVAGLAAYILRPKTR
jgi:hypothetical protein